MLVSLQHGSCHTLPVKFLLSGDLHVAASNGLFSALRSDQAAGLSLQHPLWCFSVSSIFLPEFKYLGVSWLVLRLSGFPLAALSPLRWLIPSCILKDVYEDDSQKNTAGSDASSELLKHMARGSHLADLFRGLIGFTKTCSYPPSSSLFP